MNIFVSGSSTILASCLIEEHFRKGDTIFVMDDIACEDIALELHNKFSSPQIDIVYLLHGEDLINSAGNRTQLQQKTRQQLHFTMMVCNHFAIQSPVPQTLYLASSDLIYQAGTEEKSTEDAQINPAEFPSSFFNELEEATQPAQKSGIRTILLRLGRMICRTSAPSFPWLIFGDRHFSSFAVRKADTSWVSLEDAMRAITFLEKKTPLSGAVNLCSGDIVKKAEIFNFTGNRLKNQRIFFLPKSLVRLSGGKYLAGLQEASTKAVPFKLMEAGFLFEDISLQEYLSAEHFAS
ncbi:MAG: hypothetical protein V2I36_01285 [Desulfopila sp.]|jgi:NAD dependent epimerase/dehydratase family enzyme|nr:hypothetical protein [Desulfopila sp.]